jgi:hypothetical protein
MKEKIMKWYNQGLWTEEMVINALVKNVITADDYNEIIGKKEDK